MNLEDTRPAAAEAGQSFDAAILGPIPARYTPAVHQVICENIRAGNRPVTAAQMAGIPSGVFYKWMQLGKEGNPHLYQFAEDVEVAGGHAEGKMLQIVTRDEDPENAKWYLERTRPAGYSKEVNAKVEAILADVVARLRDGLTDKEYIKVLSLISGGAAEAETPAKFQLSGPKVVIDAVIEEP